MIRLLMVCCLFLILMACSRSTGVSSLMYVPNAQAEIEKKMREHGTICYFIDEYEDCSKEEVPRVILDSLDSESTFAMNAYMSRLNPSYPDSAEFVIIRYYPGKDISNSTGRASRNSIGKKNKVLVEQVDANPKIALVNVYKNNKGLERMSKHLDWVQDENLLVTKTLFIKHYPGSSYAILHKSGKYYAYYGEHAFDAPLIDAELFMSLLKDEE